MQSSKKYYVYSDNDSISMRYIGRTSHIPLVVGFQNSVLFNSQNGFQVSVLSTIYRAPAPIYDPNDVGQQNSYKIYNDAHVHLSYMRRF
jgi:hypothetical protein